MIRIVYEDQTFRWIDIMAPDKEELSSLATTYHIHPALVSDCLAPEHLPKFENAEGAFFLILRILDEKARLAADTIQKLTNKVAVFVGDHFIITVHRREESFIEQVHQDWKKAKIHGTNKDAALLNILLKKSIETFLPVIQELDKEIDAVEREIFDEKKKPSLIRQMYFLKRRTTVFKKIMLLTRDVMHQFARSVEANPFNRDLIERAEEFCVQADEFNENVNSLLNLHISLASHRTNEVIGVLTVMSLIFCHSPLLQVCMG